MKPCGPSSASTAAAWLMLLVLDVLWDCSLSIALISGSGAPAKPIRQPHDVGIADPAGGGDDRLVARVHGGDHGVEDHLLAAGGDDDLLGLVVEAAVALELGGDGPAQGGGAGHVGVFGVTLLDGAD